MGPQRWNPEAYARHARFVSDLGAAVLELLEPKSGERVLDLGCGDGVLTAKLVAAGCIVVALDSSQEQARTARKRGLDTIVADGELLPFDQYFDAVFSNAVLHWIRNSNAVLASVYRALKSGGRFVAELGGAGNVETIRAAMGQALLRRGMDPAAHDPWMFPGAEEYSRLLEIHGFRVRKIALFSRPTVLPGHLSDWLETFAQPYLSAVDPDDRGNFIREVCTAVQPHLYDQNRGWVADYVRLRFEAVRTPR
jgi:SAM-dependent methyltransferase